MAGGAPGWPAIKDGTCEHVITSDRKETKSITFAFNNFQGIGLWIKKAWDQEDSSNVHVESLVTLDRYVNTYIIYIVCPVN